MHYRLFFTLAVWMMAGLCVELLAQDTVVRSPKSDSTVNIAEYGNSLHFNQSEIRRLPFQKLSSFGMMSASGYQMKGDNTYYYGMASDGSNTYINGMQVQDASNFPVRLIESYKLYTRQAPINRGFTVGGITTIETLCPDEFLVQVDVNTDQAYSMQGTNGEILVNIPFVSKKDHQSIQCVPGLLIAGKFATTNNTNPVWKKTQRLNNETLANLTQDPLRQGESGMGTYLNAEFVTANDLVDQKIPENSGRTGFYPYIQLSLPILNNGMLQLGNYSTIDETQVYSRGNSIFKKYWQNENLTSSRIRNGWFYPGDIGRKNGEGYLTIIDRKSDVILKSGFHIHATEIEQVLRNHAKVKDAAVISVPHPEHKEDVLAFVVPEVPDSISEREVIEYCREQFPVYKCPQGVKFISELPKTKMGKVLKRKLKTYK